MQPRAFIASSLLRPLPCGPGEGGASRSPAEPRPPPPTTPQVRESRSVPKLIPPETFDVPFREQEAQQRARRLTPLSSSMGAFPWRPSDTGPGAEQAAKGGGR